MMQIYVERERERKREREREGGERENECCLAVRSLVTRPFVVSG